MDESLGMELFITKTPGVGGRIKVVPEDFVVEEISTPPPQVLGGPFTAAVVRSRNWETNRLVRAMARNLGISRRRITFAGTKDKRAVTTQLILFEAPPEAVGRLRLRDVEVLQAHATDQRISLGELQGNRFRVAISQVSLPHEEVVARLEAIMEELREHGGFPNFFGVQRFGVVRPVTHLVGRHIVEGDYQAAVRTYVANPLEGEGPEAVAARAALEARWDFAEALRIFPKQLTFEKAVLNHLVAHPGDYVGAIQRLPHNLQLMFIHAYQSYLFNRILSRRLRQGLPLGRPVEGDIILPLDRQGLPDRDRPIEVTGDNLDRLQVMCAEGKAFVSAIVPGSEPLLASGAMGEVERAVLREEGFDARRFIIPEAPHLTTRGTRREVMIPLWRMPYQVEDGRVLLSFELPRGAYATSLLREVMKAGPMSY
jgi:tRNA pseudouridine13 synthase